MYGLSLESIDLSSEQEKDEVICFLQKFDLILDEDVDYTVVLRDNNRSIKATCSKAGNIFKCFAVSEDMRGENLTSSLISHLIDKSFNEGIFHNFIFTKPDRINVFTSLNFKLLYRAEKAALLEYGIYNIDKFLDSISEKYSIDNNIESTALVMNCNPFTKGHRYLVEEAAKNCNQVLLFLVEEDRSDFPFSDRYTMVKTGTQDLKNVKVIPAGEYIISQATFPNYFIKKADERLQAYEEIDSGIFGKYICKRFNIKKRFVGKEPYCDVTSTYNETLKKIMPIYNVEVVEIEREKYNEEYISASKVRKLLCAGRMDVIEKIVPQSTWQFLNSDRGRDIVKNKLHKAF